MNNQTLLRKGTFLTPQGDSKNGLVLKLLDFITNMKSNAESNSITIVGGLFLSNDAYSAKREPYQKFTLTYTTEGIEIQNGKIYLLSELMDNLTIDAENDSFNVNLDWLLTQLDENGEPLSKYYQKV